MGYTESIKKEITTFIENAQEDEQITNLTEVKCMKNDIIGFFC